MRSVCEVAELSGLVLLVSGAGYGTALVRGTQGWPGKVLLIVFIPGTVMMSSMTLWEATPSSLKSMTEVSRWFPIRERLSDISMAVSLMPSA